MNIELLETHRHAGVDYQKGDVLTLDQDLANWLIRLGVAKRASPKPDNTRTSLKPELTTTEEKSQ